MTQFIDGFTPYKAEDAEKYNRLRYWPGLTFGDIIDRAADIYPDKKAFSDTLSSLTFGQARDDINQLAVGLMKAGIRPMDRVLVQLPNWREFALVFFALQKIGAIDVLLIDRYRTHEIDHIASLSGARAWIVPRRYKKTEYGPIIQELTDKGNVPEIIIQVRTEQENSSRLTLESVSAGISLSKDDLDQLASLRPDPMQVAHMGPTGGSTGLPKLVPRTHNDLICASWFCAMAWELSARDVILLVGPIGHDLTFTKGFLAGVLTFATCIFLDSTDLEEICRTIEKEKVTTIVWVPALARRLVDYDRRGNFDLTSLKKMHCGGGASLAGLIEDVQERLDCRFFNGYGATEGQTALTRSGDPDEVVKQCVGKPTCPYDTYKIINPSGEVMPEDTPGELVIKGPGVFTGYYKSPDENRKAFTPDGFFRTGDVARIDSQGRITICGRMKEMINRGGESISATEIEALICRHPDVACAAVVPMPDPKLGEKACAYIETKNNICLSFDEVIEFLKEQGASVLLLPERMEFIGCMPMTKANKIDKCTLEEQIRAL